MFYNAALSDMPSEPTRDNKIDSSRMEARNRKRSEAECCYAQYRIETRMAERMPQGTMCGATVANARGVT